MKPPYQQTVLPDGMRVLTLAVPERESVCLAVWVKAGSRHEPANFSGISHFIEHMVFKGTKKRSTRQIKEAVEGAGGILNAFTGEESTCYFAKIMKPSYVKALDVLADIVNNAVMDPIELEKEREVILEEIHMVQDQPSQHVEDLISSLLWPGHPLGRPISGSIRTVSAMKRADLAGYQKKYYHGSNFVLGVSGPVQHEEIVKLARRFFRAKAGGKPLPKNPFEGHRKGMRILIQEKKAEQANFVVGVPAFSRYHPDRYKLGLLSLVLGGNMSSRLFEELRERKGLTYDVRSNAVLFEDTGALTIAAGTEADKVPLSLALIMKELARLQSRKIGALELKRAREYFLSQFHMGLEDHLDHLLWAGEALLSYGRIPAHEEIHRGIEAVTPEGILQLSRRLFKPGKLRLACIGPLGGKLREKIHRQMEKTGLE